MEWKFKVEGMMCNHCKQRVEDALKSIYPKAKINIDLNNKEVVLENSNIDKDLVKKNILKLNFKVVE